MHPSSPEFQSLSPFQQLVEVVAALRAPDGCPWDRKQTHQTLTPFLVEEAYECVEALELNDDSKMQEELGDLAFQVVLHAQLARERGAFDVEDICEGIVAKMVRRHPHVFERGSGELDTPAAVLQQWDQIKRREKGDKAETSALDGVSSGLPSLPQAALLQERAARAGFVYPDAASAWSKLQEELEEFRSRPSEEELGDVLFALVSLAHQHGFDPEAALRATNRKFRNRYQGLERRFPGGLKEQSPAELVTAWREIALRSPEAR